MGQQIGLEPLSIQSYPTGGAAGWQGTWESYGRLRQQGKAGPATLSTQNGMNTDKTEKCPPVQNAYQPQRFPGHGGERNSSRSRKSDRVIIRSEFRSLMVPNQLKIRRIVESEITKIYRVQVEQRVYDKSLSCT